jgi:hypothetical protein
MEDAETIIGRLDINLSRQVIDGNGYLRVSLTYQGAEVASDSIRMKEFDKDYQPW